MHRTTPSATKHRRPTPANDADRDDAAIRRNWQSSISSSNSARIRDEKMLKTMMLERGRQMEAPTELKEEEGRQTVGEEEELKNGP